MILAIIILIYLSWIGEICAVYNDAEYSNLLITGALVTLISWYCSTPWGIVMCCVTTVITIAAHIHNTR